MLQVDVLYPVEEGYTSVSAQLVNSGLAIRGVQRPRQETIPPHVTLGCSDTRDVVVPVAENPHDFFVHIVSVCALVKIDTNLTSTDARSDTKNVINFFHGVVHTQDPFHRC